MVAKTEHALSPENSEASEKSSDWLCPYSLGYRRDGKENTGFQNAVTLAYL